MIDDAIGKILGMAMAYAVSALGLFLAYANYRRRIVGAERVMTTTAWAVVAAIVVAVVAGVVVVASLVQPGPPAAAIEAPAEPLLAAVPPPPRPEGPRWPLLGILLPAAIFLVATWITAGLYRHFSHGDR